MDHQSIIKRLAENKNLFKDLFSGSAGFDFTWKPAPEKWCLLEIACHLFDEEREDFRARVKLVLHHPEQPYVPIDPADWVISRAYMNQPYAKVVSDFLEERTQSVEWLQGLQDPPWKNAYTHPKFGPLTAEMFLANWLAHDYLHVRQIIALKYQFLKFSSGESLTYAGDW